MSSRFPAIVRNLDNELDPALRRAAEQIAEEAQSRVPVRTGALRDAIHVEDFGEQSYRVAAWSREAWYGHIVEHGGAFTPPRPFMQPAAEAVRSQIDDLIRIALKDL